MNVETMLHEEIVDKLGELKGVRSGTDEYKTGMNNVTQLVDRAIEMEKIHTDRELRLKQMEDEQKDRLVKNYIAVAGIVIPSAITIWGTLKSFEFEKEGTITTMMGRGFINKLFPKK